MCDDGFSDDMDGSIEADNDIQEDLADEDGEEWEASEEDLIDEPANLSSDIIGNETDHFDLTDAIVLGMLAGSTYDAAVDENLQSKLARSKSKPIK